MTHNSAVQAVVGLVPEIEKQGAEAALTAYAEREDLPPAQLEKLAQVFNTLRQVSHIDNAAEDARGATVPLVNVPELVTGYATGIGAEKSASPVMAQESHAPNRVDLMRELRREMSPPAAIEKAASTVAVIEEVFSDKEIVDALLDMQIDTRERMGKLASAILATAQSDEEGTRDIATYELDAMQGASKPSVRDAGDWVEKYAKPHRVAVRRIDYAEDFNIEKRAFSSVSSHGGDLMLELAECVSFHDSLQKMADENLALFRRSLIDSGLSAPPAYDPGKDEKGKKSEGMDDLNQNVDDGAESINTADGGGSESAAPPAEKPPRGPVSNSRREVSQGGAAKPSTPAAPVEGKIPNVVGGIRGLLKSVGSGVRGVASKADETLLKITGKEWSNSAQRSTDLSVSEIKQAISVRRMIGTDAVLREHDPKEVLELYHAIAQQNPALASNMASVKLVLREGVSYDGLTLDAAKQLSDIRKNTGSSEQQESENDRRQYSAGGGVSLQRKV